MDQGDELPLDDDEVIELLQKIIKKETENPGALDLPVPLEELQEWLKKILELKHDIALTEEAEEEVRKKEEATWEEYYLAVQDVRETGRKHGMSESEINMLLSGKFKQANRMFSQFRDQDPIVYIPQKDKDPA